LIHSLLSVGLNDITTDCDAISVVVSTDEMTLDRKELIRSFLMSFGSTMTLRCNLPNRGTGSRGKDGVFGCFGNKCQHLPNLLSGHEMLVIDTPIKIALHESCQSEIIRSLSKKGCYLSASNCHSTGVCFNPKAAANQPNYRVLIEAIIESCKVNDTHIIHVADIGCRLSFSSSDVMIDSFFNHLNAMSERDIKVELVQMDIGFVSKMQEGLLVQGYFNKRPNELSHTVLHGVSPQVFPLHKLPPIKNSPLTKAKLKGTLLLKEKDWINNLKEITISSSEEDFDVCFDEREAAQLFLAPSTESQVRKSIDVISSTIHSVKAYSTVSHSLMQTRSNYPLTYKSMLAVGRRSIDSLQTLLTNVDTASSRAFKIVREHGIGFRIEVSVRPQFLDPIRWNGHFNDILLLVHFAIRDLCKYFEPQIDLIPIGPIQTETTKLMSEMMSMLKFRHTNAFETIYANPSHVDWLRSHISILLVTTGISPSYSTRFINEWLKDQNRYDPFNRGGRVNRDQDHRSHERTLLNRFQRVLKTIKFSDAGVRSLIHYAQNQSIVDPKELYQELSLRNKHLLAVHLWNRIIRQLSIYSRPSNVITSSLPPSENDIPGFHQEEVEEYDTWWTKFETYSDQTLNNQIAQSETPVEPLSLLIFSLCKISSLWNPGRIAFNQILCKFILASHNCPNLNIGDIVDRNVFKLLIECAEDGKALTRDNYRQICSHLCSSSLVGNSSMVTYQKLLCETYYFPWSSTCVRLEKDPDRRLARNKLLNQTLDNDIVSIVHRTNRSTTYYRVSENRSIRIRSWSSLVALGITPTSRPLYQNFDLYRVLAESVNSHPRVCFRSFLRSRLAGGINVWRMFLSSVGTIQHHFKGLSSIEGVEQRHNFLINPRGRLSDLMLICRYIPEILVAMTCYVYRRHFIFYDMAKNETFYFYYCKENRCSIKYDFDHINIIPSESTTSLRVTPRKMYVWNGTSQRNTRFEISHGSNSVLSSHPFSGSPQRGSALNILPGRKIVRGRSFQYALMLVLSELDERYVDNKGADDPLGLLNFLEEMSCSPRRLTLFSDRVQAKCTELTHQFRTLWVLLNTKSMAELNHTLLCPLTCLKYQNIKLGVFERVGNRRTTSFYWFNKVIRRVDSVTLDQYNVFHQSPDILYLYTSETASHHYTCGITPELKGKHHQNYHDTIIGCYSHLGECQYSNTLEVIGSMFEIKFLQWDNIQPNEYRPENPNVVVIATQVTCKTGGNLDQISIYGTPHHALVLIFPLPEADEIWDCCIIHHPFQDEKPAADVLNDKVVRRAPSEGKYIEHCLKGVNVVGSESCYLMILYALLGSRSTNLNHFRLALDTLRSEKSLSSKVRQWISEMIGNNRKELPAWISQIPNLHTTEPNESLLRRNPISTSAHHHVINGKDTPKASQSQCKRPMSHKSDRR